MIVNNQSIYNLHFPNSAFFSPFTSLANTFNKCAWANTEYSALLFIRLLPLLTCPALLRLIKEWRSVQLMDGAKYWHLMVGRRACVKILGGIIVMQSTLGVMLLLLRDRQSGNKRANVKVLMTSTVTLAFPEYVPWEDILFTCIVEF